MFLPQSQVIASGKYRWETRIDPIFKVGDVDKAKAFLSSDDLKQKMTDAGVTSPPNVYFGRSA